MRMRSVLACLPHEQRKEKIHNYRLSLFFKYLLEELRDQGVNHNGLGAG